MPGNSSDPLANARRQDWLYAAGLVILTGVVFWPAARWLATQTFAREQMRQSFLIVVLAGLYIAWEKRANLRLDLRLSNTTFGWLFVSYAFAGAAIFFKEPVLILAGLVAAVGGMVNYIFGEGLFGGPFLLLSVFTVLIVCVLIFPVLDWPLRQMAGVESAKFLKFCGLAPHLAVTSAPDVRLLLVSGQQSFIVATECNGFGLISSSLLLGLILLLYWQAKAWKYILLLPVCVGLAFVFNFLRISTIVLLASSFPKNYATLHETAGIIALYSGLGLVWFLTGSRTMNR